MIISDLEILNELETKLSCVTFCWLASGVALPYSCVSGTLEPP